jgi:hypothetical protein
MPLTYRMGLRVVFSWTLKVMRADLRFAEPIGIGSGFPGLLVWAPAAKISILDAVCS